MHTNVSLACVLALPSLAAAQSETLTLAGDAAGDQFGWSVAAVGDVDGDGHDDFAVGAPYNDAGGTNAGQVEVISGRSHLPVWIASGSIAQGLFGYALAPAGDIDVDGTPDIVVGAPGSSTSGYVEVRSGATGLVLLSLASLPTEQRFGAAVAGGFDVDGDSLPDLLVGAPGTTGDPGAVRVFSSAGGALIRQHDAPWRYESLGFSLAFIGDLDGDARAEYALGAPAPLVGYGAGYVDCMDGATGVSVWMTIGDYACAEFGWSLASIGDLDGDGLRDLVVGDRGDNKIPCIGLGKVTVLRSVDGFRLATYTQNTTHYTGLGQSVTVVGDIDGDGKEELAGGAPGSWGPTVATEVRVWKYGAMPPLQLTLPPGDSDDHFGQSLASADATGDGLRDLIVGEPFDDDNGSDSGTVHVYTFVRAPTVYCESESNSLGCTPAIASTGVASATLASPFDVNASSVLNNKSGLLFYGFKPRQTPFQGGHMCVVAPTVRTPVQSSGGSAPPVSNCSGAFSLDFNARIQSGVNPLLVAGEEVFAQYWSRDPADASTTNLTDALAFYIAP